MEDLGNPVTNLVVFEQEQVVEEKVTILVSHAEQGPPGPAAPVGGISADPGNAVEEGADGGLYVPDDIETDPLAYYILARN